MFRRGLQAMTNHGWQYDLEIFRQNQITAFEESPGPGTVQQCQSGARNAFSTCLLDPIEVEEKGRLS